jgi:hypothetical protein
MEVTPPAAVIAAATNASVASFVVVSPGVWVVAVVPLGNAGVPLKLAAVPEVFAALLGMSAETNARNVGVWFVPLVGPANTSFAGIDSSVAVTAPVDTELLRTTPSPVNEVTPLEGAFTHATFDPVELNNCPLVPADADPSVRVLSSVRLPLNTPPVSGRYTVERDGMSAVTRARNVGVATPPDTGPAHTVLAVCVLNEKVKAGVVVAVATDDVTMLSMFPALKDVTVPPEEAGVAHAGSPATTVNTCPAVPMGKRAAVGVAFS